MIVVLDGPINAGKSTVGAMLARRLPHTVHIEVDDLRHFAGSLTLQQVIPYALADAADLASSWTGRGFHVIVSWPIDKANLHHFAAAAAEAGTPFFAFTLLPRLDIALGNRGQRDLTDAEKARIKEMYAEMYSGGRGAGIIIDNSDQGPEETTQAIMAHIESKLAGHETPSAGGEAPDLIFTITGQPAPADVAYIRQRIKEFNDSVSEHHRAARATGKEPLAALLHDSAGQLVGGLIASVYWGWLDIDELWIGERWRGQGLGRTLMKTVEKVAIKRGCRFAQVTTWDFQALGFYEGLGFKVTGCQEDYPPGRTFYWLRKELAHRDP